MAHLGTSQPAVSFRPTATTGGLSMKRTYDIWGKKPAADNYSAASEYLKLLFSDAKAKAIVRRLRAGGTIQFQAKDLLRASQTHLLDKANPKVASNLKHIKKGEKLSPVLLVRGNGG